MAEGSVSTSQGLPRGGCMCCLPSSRLSRTALVVGALIVAYWALSSGLTLYNKWLLSVHGFHFPFLLITSTYTMFTAFTCTLRGLCPPRISGLDQPIPPRRTFLRYFIPIGSLSAFEIAASNYSLLWITVSLHTVILASKPIFVLFGDGCLECSE